MKTTTIKKINNKKQIKKPINNLDFWKKVALQQQTIIHGKNKT